MKAEGIYLVLLAFGWTNVVSVVNVMGPNCPALGVNSLQYSVNHSMTLRGANYSGYAPFICTAVLKAANPLKRLMIQFDEFDLKPTDKIYVFDGPSIASPPSMAQPISSGASAYESFYKSTGQLLTVEFVSSTGHPYSIGFNALITEFHDGHCGSQEMECCDEVCISEILKNNLEFNCRDKNDEIGHECDGGGLHYSELMWIIIGGVTGSIFLILIIGCLIGCYISAKQRKDNRRRRRNNPHLTTVAYPRSVAGPGIPMSNISTISGYPQLYPQQDYPAPAYSYITPVDTQGMAPPPYQTVAEQNAAATSQEQANTSL